MATGQPVGWRMALFSWSMQIIKRSAGRSVVAASAYRAGERLHDERQSLTHDYRNRGGVEHTELLFPADAPEWTNGIGREVLWNTVEEGEKRKDAQTARELRIMSALPHRSTGEPSLPRPRAVAAFRCETTNA